MKPAEPNGIFVRHQSWDKSFDLASKLKVLSLRWEGKVVIEQDDFTGAYVAWCGEVPLASGTTPAEAADNALTLERGRRSS